MNTDPSSFRRINKSYPWVNKSYRWQWLSFGIGFVLIITLSLFIGSRSYDNAHKDLSHQIEQKHLSVQNQVSALLTQRSEVMLEHLLKLKLQLITQGFLNPSKTLNRADLDQSFIQSAQSSDSIANIRWIDAHGNEQARIDRVWVNQQWQVSSSQALQNKADRYYFLEAIHLRNNQIYSSELDLNREFNQVVVPFEPTIRMAVSTHEAEENLQEGLLVVNHNIASILHRVNQQLSPDIALEIIDTEGFWVLNSQNPNMEWGQDTGRSELTLKEQQPQLFRALQNLSGRGGFQTSNLSQLSSLTLFAKQSNPITFYIRTSTPQAVIDQIHQDSLIDALQDGIVSFIILLGLVSLFFRKNLKQRQQDNNLISILNKAFDPIFLLSSNKIIIYANHISEQLFEYRAPLINTQADSLLPNNVFPSMGHPLEIELYSDQKPHYYLARLEEIQLNDKKRYLLTLRDITTERASLKQLQKQNWRMDKILSGTNLGTWEWNIQTGETFLNERWANIIGYTLEELQPISIDTWMTHTHQDDLVIGNEKLQAHFNGETDYYELECRMWHKDGSIVWVLDKGRVLSWTDDGEPLVMYGIHQDITAQKELEKVLQRNKEQAEQLNRAKDIFLANMSHEIRTPISGVIGTLNLLQDTKLDATQENLLNISKRSAESMLDLVNDILDLSKINAGKLEIETVPFRLNSLLNDIAAPLGQKANEKGIDFACPNHYLPQLQVTGDPLRIRQILTNLISNAIKFTSYGEVTLEVDFSHASSKNTDKGLEFTIRDTGIGLTTAQQERLFQRFEQADSSTTRQYGGTGLGLHICKELVDRMGGSLHAYSIEGEGSVFSFKLPLPVKEQSQEKHSLSLENQQVLVCYPKTATQEMLSRLFSAWSMNATVVNQGEDAFLALHEARSINHPVHILIFDQDALEQESSNLLRMIRSDTNFSDLKLLAITSPCNKETQQTLSASVDSILYKPVIHSDLLNRLEELIADSAEPLSGNVSTLPEKDHHHVLSGHILIAEDNPTNQLITQAMVEKIGLTCDIVNNGQEAITALQHQYYDIVLMDCQMPIVDGYQATQALRKSQHWLSSKDTPVIALTANAMKGDDQRCYSAGMNDYLSKPLYSEQLTKILAKFMTKKVSPALEYHPHEQPINWPELNERLSHDQGLIQEVLSTFLDELPKLIQDLDDCSQESPLQESLIDALKSKTHNLKGVAANIAAAEIRYLAEQLEIILRAPNETPEALQDKIQSHITHIHSAFARFKNDVLQSLNTASR